MIEKFTANVISVECQTNSIVRESGVMSIKPFRAIVQLAHFPSDSIMVF